MTEEQIDRLLDLLEGGVEELGQGDEVFTIIGGLYAIAKSLDRIGAALDGPWPYELAKAFRGDRPEW